MVERDPMGRMTRERYFPSDIMRLLVHSSFHLVTRRGAHCISCRISRASTISRWCPGGTCCRWDAHSKPEFA